MLCEHHPDVGRPAESLPLRHLRYLLQELSRQAGDDRSTAADSTRVDAISLSHLLRYDGDL